MSDILFMGKDIKYKDILSYQHINIIKNKVNFIVGESGSGKSTLLKMLNLSISISSGTLFYKDASLESYEPILLRREVSLISQEPFLFDESILDNFRKFYALRQLPEPSLEAINFFTELCCVNTPLTQMATTLSGGERQRVYIAIFLSFLPKVILLDEPTSALDEKNSINMMENIVNFCKEKTIDIVVVSHDTNVIAAFSENKIELRKVL